MYRQNLTRLLLTPSLLSGTVVLSLTAAICADSAWTYISNNQLLYDYLFGAYGFKTYLWQSSAHATALRNAFFGSLAAYYILVFVAATTGGLIVYTLLQGLSLFVSSTRRIWLELDTLGSTRHAILAKLFSRLGLRTLSLVGWTIYAAFFFSTLIPFSVILIQTGVAHINNGAILGWLDCILAALLLTLAMHLHVIFVRLIFLRPRLFFGDRAIEEAEAREDND
jgi:hypothetical protein